LAQSGEFENWQLTLLRPQGDILHRGPAAAVTFLTLLPSLARAVLRQLHLSNFKCFNKHTVSFERTTVLVGKNNAGKSTIVEALHLVAAVVNRKAASFIPPPRWADLPRFQPGIAPSVAHLDFDLRKVFHRYGEPPAVITASFEGGIKALLPLLQ